MKKWKNQNYRLMKWESAAWFVPILIMMMEEVVFNMWARSSGQFKFTLTQNLIQMYSQISTYWMETSCWYSISQEIYTRFLLCCALVVVIHCLIFPYPSGLLHWHCGNLTIAPVPATQPWWIWINTHMWIHFERLHNHNKARHNKTVCIFLGIYCRSNLQIPKQWRQQ